MGLRELASLLPRVPNPRVAVPGCGEDRESHSHLVLRPQKIWLSCLYCPGLYGYFSRVALHYICVLQGTQDIWVGWERLSSHLPKHAMQSIIPPMVLQFPRWYYKEIKHKTFFQGPSDLSLSHFLPAQGNLFHPRENSSLSMLLSHTLSLSQGHKPQSSQDHSGIKRWWWDWLIGMCMPICGPVAQAHHMLVLPQPIEQSSPESDCQPGSTFPSSSCI